MTQEVEEIMMSVPTSTAVQQASILAMRSLQSSVDRLATGVEEFGKDLKDVREKVVAIEAIKLDQQLISARRDAKEDLSHATQALQREIDSLILARTAMEVRLRTVETILGKHQLALAIVGAIGLSALGLVLGRIAGLVT